jgi:hypothetical protein
MMAIGVPPKQTPAAPLKISPEAMASKLWRRGQFQNRDSQFGIHDF